jgi:hypothetical protein
LVTKVKNGQKNQFRKIPKKAAHICKNTYELSNHNPTSQIGPIFATRKSIDPEGGLPDFICT